MENFQGKCMIYSKNVTVNGVDIHYLQSGQGAPMVFVHGMPTSSYLWRKIIPTMAPYATCIAMDLVGMGQSAKPDIDFTVFEHIDYFEAFIAELDLKNITLVMHGWGSLIACEYARRHPENIAALVFYESHLRPAFKNDMLSLPVQQMASMLARPEVAKHAIMEKNYLVNKLLPASAVSPLDADALEQYAKPFIDKSHRKLLWQYVQELPVGEKDSKVVELIAQYSQWLQHTPIPKLLLYAIPGFITTIDTVSWAKDHLSNLSLVALEDVMHLAQETSPTLFSIKLLDWYLQLKEEASI